MARIGLFAELFLLSVYSSIGTESSGSFEFELMKVRCVYEFLSTIRMPQ